MAADSRCRDRHWASTVVKEVATEPVDVVVPYTPEALPGLLWRSKRLLLANLDGEVSSDGTSWTEMDDKDGCVTAAWCLQNPLHALQLAE